MATEDVTGLNGRAVIGVRCPTCNAVAGERCRTRTGAVATRFHKARPNTPGFTGRDDTGRQLCLACQRWKYPAIHSCPGVPQRPNLAAALLTSLS